MTKQCIRLEVQSQNKHLNQTVRSIERPFTSLTTIVRVDHDKMMQNSTLQLGWGHVQVMQMVSTGFKVDIFSKCKTCMLPVLISDIGNALDDAKAWAAQTIIADATTRLASFNAGSYTPFHMEDSERTWAMTTNVGLQTMSFPSGLQQHRFINANPFVASLIGMHLEEYLSRTAACEMPIPLIELDALLFILFRTVLDAFGTVQNESYIRGRCGLRGCALRSYLMCLRTVAVFEGREIREVRPPPPAIPDPNRESAASSIRSKITLQTLTSRSLPRAYELLLTSPPCLQQCHSTI
jgi:hypothetical protein